MASGTPPLSANQLLALALDTSNLPAPASKKLLTLTAEEKLTLSRLDLDDSSSISSLDSREIEEIVAQDYDDTSSLNSLELAEALTDKLSFQYFSQYKCYKQIQQQISKELLPAIDTSTIPNCFRHVLLSLIDKIKIADLKLIYSDIFTPRIIENLPSIFQSCVNSIFKFTETHQGTLAAGSNDRELSNEAEALLALSCLNCTILNFSSLYNSSQSIDSLSQHELLQLQIDLLIFIQKSLVFYKTKSIFDTT